MKIEELAIVAVIGYVAYKALSSMQANQLALQQQQLSNQQTNNYISDGTELLSGLFG